MHMHTFMYMYMYVNKIHVNVCVCMYAYCMHTYITKVIKNKYLWTFIYLCISIHVRTYMYTGVYNIHTCRVQK